MHRENASKQSTARNVSRHCEKIRNEKFRNVDQPIKWARRSPTAYVVAAEAVCGVLFSDDHAGVASDFAHVAAAVDISADGGGAEDADLGAGSGDGCLTVAAAED